MLLRVAGWFPATGTAAFLPTLAIMSTLLVTVFITSSILVASMVADVAEDSEVRTGRRPEGVFFAANAFVQKSVSGIGIFTSTLLLRAVGFPRDAKPGHVAPEVIQNLGLIYGPAVVVLYLCALGFWRAIGSPASRTTRTWNGSGAARPRRTQTGRGRSTSLRAVMAAGHWAARVLKATNNTSPVGMPRTRASIGPGPRRRRSGDIRSRRDDACDRRHTRSAQAND